MARSKTAQPKHSLRKIAVVVATAVSGMSVYAQAAVSPVVANLNSAETAIKTSTDQKLIQLWQQASKEERRKFMLWLAEQRN